MPELPEVETIARDLAPRLRGQRIRHVQHDRQPPVFDRHSLPPRRLVGRTIVDVGRAGKFVVLRLEGDLRLAVHLRMTGQLLFLAAKAPLRYSRAVLDLESGAALVFADTRKFGRMRIFTGDPAASLTIGIDPFDRRLDAAHLTALTRGRKTPVKVWLLDQKRLGGVGNIYASEALYDAGIRPKRAVGRLSGAERSRLLVSLRRILRKAIRHRGSSVDDYVDAAGLQGSFQNKLAVYGRAGMKCRRCSTPIRRIVLAQRGTFYCPSCQR
ncbi:MAG: bifunctional DNA-formamidopyrimidine glycosylase/DNA-(apurinic or apyrimidinic site) lyase [Candidatus Eremiobacteraeota bacterium]|nr:bifunctional DNA-formamidopyrimidine glycosylase/DNA-(apurinic or apyrimidinic site) lyase [Candidatus Eremiobacteraeota bacterium]